MENTLSIAAGVFTLVTETAVSVARVQNLSPHNSLFIRVTKDATPPANLNGGVKLGPEKILLADIPLHVLFPGTLAQGEAGRIWL